MKSDDIYDMMRDVYLEQAVGEWIRNDEDHLLSYTSNEREMERIMESPVNQMISGSQ